MLWQFFQRLVFFSVWQYFQHLAILASGDFRGYKIFEGPNAVSDEAAISTTAVSNEAAG